MKKYIMYYYNININDISYENNRYFVRVGEKEFIFEQCKNVELLKYYNTLIKQLGMNNNEYSFEIIKNIADSQVTYINGIPYILLYSNINDYKKNMRIIDLADGLNKNINIQGFYSLSRYPWDLLWEKKVDYIENWFKQKEQLYKKEIGTIWFLIGLGENAIAYFKNIVGRNKRAYNEITVQHNRIMPNMRMYDYYDVNNIVIDHSSRDLGEYIKSSIFQNKFDLYSIDEYLCKHQPSKEWIELLYARILFPNCFFDELEKYAMTQDQGKINFDLIESKIMNFCKNLKEIGEYLEKKYGINTVKWI